MQKKVLTFPATILTLQLYWILVKVTKSNGYIMLVNKIAQNSL